MKISKTEEFRMGNGGITSRIYNKFVYALATVTQQMRKRCEMILAVILIKKEAFHGKINLNHK